MFRNQNGELTSLACIEYNYEGHTFIPAIERLSAKFDLDKPVIVADSGLLSKVNIKAFVKKVRSTLSAQDQVIGQVYGNPESTTLPGDLRGPKFKPDGEEYHRVWQDKFYLLPIRQNILDANPNISQNLGW